MNLEIKAIIEKNLPAQVGDLLKVRLEQAEKDVRKLKEQEEELQMKTTQVLELTKQLEEYSEADKRNATLELREKAVIDAERNLKITILEAQLAAEIDKTKFSKEVALGLVRNSQFRKTIFDRENQTSYQGPNGTWIHPTPVNKSLEENKTSL